jgi:hypothetical protein
VSEKVCRNSIFLLKEFKFPYLLYSLGCWSHHQRPLWRTMVSLEKNTPSPSPHSSPDPQTYCIWPYASIDRSGGGGGGGEEEEEKADNGD